MFRCSFQVRVVAVVQGGEEVGKGVMQTHFLLVPDRMPPLRADQALHSRRVRRTILP
jgi:hypothetical protein